MAATASMKRMVSSWGSKKVTAVALSFCLLTGLTYYCYPGRPFSPRQYHMLDLITTTSEEYLGCDTPLYGYKAWNQSVITSIRPNFEKDCSKLIAGDPEETGRVMEANKAWESQTSYRQLLSLSRDCPQLRDTFRNNVYITKLEAAFPIAFSFLVYDSPEQFLRLLRVLYRPGNVYCIHPDKKSEYRQFFINLAKCFPNIIIAKSRVDVSWGAKSLLVAQMHCLSDLDHYRQQQREEERWKYVINLCGKEVPLLSVGEMVWRLVGMNGTSSIVAWSIPESEFWTMARLNGKTLPYNLTYYKSMTYNALSEPFVTWLLHNSTAKEMFEFFMETQFAEEHFYATVFRMPGVPGGYNPRIPIEGYFEVGHYFWRTNAQEIKLPCHGKTVHGICVVNFADLPRIMKETQYGQTALFHNKYFMELDHVIMDCMEERIVAKNKREFKLECSQGGATAGQ